MGPEDPGGGIGRLFKNKNSASVAMIAGFGLRRHELQPVCFSTAPAVREFCNGRRRTKAVHWSAGAFLRKRLRDKFLIELELWQQVLNLSPRPLAMNGNSYSFLVDEPLAQSPFAWDSF
jgi:hypothetical protein